MICIGNSKALKSKHGRLLVIVVVVERKGRRVMEFYFCVQALMREGPGGRKKYLTSSGRLEKMFKEKTKIPIAPPPPPPQPIKS